MARNIGMGSPRRGLGGISRAKMMARYPRLLRKKPIRLQTILEVPEELVHEAVSQPHDHVNTTTFPIAFTQLTPVERLLLMHKIFNHF